MANPLLAEVGKVVTDGITPLVTRIEKLEQAPVYKAHATPIDRTVEKAWGFRDLGHFASEVVKSRKSGAVSEMIQKSFGSELVTKAATGMGELVGSDGGFLVPPQFSEKIFEKVFAPDALLSKTDGYTTAGNSMVFPRLKEDSRADGSRHGGVLSYWVSEGDEITASRPRFGRLEMILHKLACLGVVTEELLNDSGTALNTYLTNVFSKEISFQVGNAIFRGTGAGQPLGILNADCGVSVAKENGQSAGTLVSANIAKMWARRFTGGGETGSYVWLINQDISSQLYLMTLGIGTAGVTTYMPPGGLSGKPYATLMGAPVIEVEYASTLGTKGDIALVDLSQYITLTKSQGMQTQTSMHLYFATDQQAFRTTFRVAGQPWWPAPLTPYKGTATQSPFVFLDTRS